MPNDGIGHVELGVALKALSFTKLFDRGWPELIPIIPPNALLRPQQEDYVTEARGKVPGVIEGDGRWHTNHWLQLTSTRESCRGWDNDYAHARELGHCHGPQIGHKAGNLIGIDCDITDKDVSKAVLGAVERYLIKECGVDESQILTRIGAKPKWLIPVRVADGKRMRGHDLAFEHGRCPNGATVQLLGEGKQFVLWGEHPKTHLPYAWRPRDPIPYVDLPTLSIEQLEGLPEVIVKAVEGVGGRLVHAGGSGPAANALVDQARLKGDRDDVADALAHIPHDGAITYDVWIQICAALKAASQDWPEEGLRLWIEFNERWTGSNAAHGYEQWLEKWERRVSPPYRVGADYLYQLAHKRGWDSARVDLRAFAQEAERTVVRKTIAADALPWADDGFRPIRLARGTSESELTHWAEKAVAHRFAEAFAEKLVFGGEFGRWYGWTGKVWAPDGTRLRVDALLQTWISAEADRWLATPAAMEMETKVKAPLMKSVRSRKFHEAVMRFLPSLFNVSTEHFDIHPELFNTQSGCVDLRTGQTVPVNAKRIITRIARTDIAEEGAVPRQWVAFLEQATQGDLELVAFLQRAMGYTLYGELPEHALFYLYGSGGNGKSVFLDVIADVLGSYATVADRNVFLRSKFQDHATTKARLAGFRYIMVPEVNEASEWNDAIIKEWSAGNWVSARFMRQDEFAFKPSGTLWFSGNSKPRLHRVDPSIERRMKMIEFRHRPAKPDIGLKNRLVNEEGPAILRWLVDGCLLWQREGLGSCRHVDEATQEYLADHDPVRRWVRERCLLLADKGNPVVQESLRRGAPFWEFANDLYEDYARWCKEQMENPITQTAFGLRLPDLPGVTKTRSASANRVNGIMRKVQIVPVGGGSTRRGLAPPPNQGRDPVLD